MASVPGRDMDHKGEVVIMARLVTTVETVGSAGAGGDGEEWWARARQERWDRRARWEC